MSRLFLLEAYGSTCIDERKLIGSESTETYDGDRKVERTERAMSSTPLCECLTCESKCSLHCDVSTMLDKEKERQMMTYSVRQKEAKKLGRQKGIKALHSVTLTRNKQIGFKPPAGKGGEVPALLTFHFSSTERPFVRKVLARHS
ncbi:hypothetical protein D918_08677 [Trichuris suis]|nr:hypothetical protein D918_08677 [Trichuris suis]